MPDGDLTSKNRDAVFCQMHLIQRGSQTAAVEKHLDTHFRQMETGGMSGIV